MHALSTAEIAWYATGRFYVAADGKVADSGYFLHLAGIEGPLFSGAPSESSAHFTFAAEPFLAHTIKNGDLTLGLDPVGEFSVYLQREPAGSFDEPASFAQGERIATFRRVSVVVGVTVAVGRGKAAEPLVSSNLFSAKLTWSREFEHAGKRQDLRRWLAHGITQSGTAATQPVEPTPPGYTAVVPFVGSAIAMGPLVG